MSGHSHARTVKHRKEAVDAKRGKIFSKLSQVIAIAAKEGGSDIDSNPRLRLAVEKAKQANMPRENIDRAIARGSGQLGDANIEEVIYEVYGPSGIALIVTGITDNKNRTVADIKQILGRFNAKLAESGSVKYLFDKKGADWIAKYPIALDEKKSQQIDNLIESLKDNDDVQEVYSNITRA